MQIERRKFLESACKACLLLGAGVLLSDLTACSPSSGVMKLPINENTIKLPVTAFAKKTLQIVRPDGWLYDIAIHKTAPEQYEALLLQCTHQRNQLLPVPNGFLCSLHGSKFNAEGMVVKGPAEHPLKKFTTSLDQGELVVQLKS